MVSLIEAYKYIKDCSDFPITYILETEDSYWGAADDYVGVNKETGELTHIQRPSLFLFGLRDDVFVSIDDIYSDFMKYYQAHSDEQNLSMLYASAWNRLFYHKNGKPEDYKCEEDRQSMITKWSEIEQSLYKDIRRIIDNENIDYPPCVQEKFDDPFYRIKPFMLRNGFTDNDIDRTWVTI